jgi:hypothetical protein
VWSWLLQHHLANRCFSGYDGIVEAGSMAWNDFVSDAKRVTKMCSRDSLKLKNIILIGIILPWVINPIFRTTFKNKFSGTHHRNNQ